MSIWFTCLLLVASVAPSTDLATQFELQLAARQTPRYHQMLSNPSAPARHLNEASGIQLQYMRETGMPVYYATLSLNTARTISTDDVWPGGSTGFNLDGSGTIIQLAMWDGGEVRDTHVALAGRIFNQQASSGDCHHPTMVAGILAAAPGFHPDVQGMSYASNVLVWDAANDDAEMVFATSNGILISNHSYEIPGGWRRIDGTWYWFGDLTISTTEDYGFGFYGSKSQSWDQIAYDYPHYFIQKGCGNDRNDGMPGPTESHVHWDPGLGWITANDSHDPDGGATGYDSVSWFGNAKNIVAVGAVEDIPGGYTQPSDVVVTNFSSFGPCDDGRIKPDVVANGKDVTSTGCDDDTTFLTGSGTSYAGPTVAGSANLLRQLYESLHGGTSPRAATLKAVILHTADEAGPADGPDYQYGWGLMNTASAAQSIALGDDFVREETLTSGTVDRYWMWVPTGEPARVTVVWTDPPGTPTAPGLDAPVPALVNDLDLRVAGTTSAVTHEPWKLDVSDPTAAATRGDNLVDNVEQVDVPAASVELYEVAVSHKGSLTLGPQAYSIIASSALMDAPTAVEHEPTIVALRAAPNPSSGRSTLSFSLPKPSSVRVRIVDLRGRVVSEVLDQSMPAGPHVVHWDGADDRGSEVSPGVYLAVVDTDRGRQAVKILRSE